MERFEVYSIYPVRRVEGIRLLKCGGEAEVS